MIAIHVTTVGDVTPAILSSMLAAFSSGVSDWTPVWPKVIERFRAQERKRFQEENAGGPSGRWGPLSPGYGAWKAKHFPGRTILFGPDRGGHKGGMLRESLAGTGAGSLIQYDSKSLFMGTTVPYATYHQTGEGQRYRRPPIDPSDRDVAEFTTEIWRYFESVKARVGFRGSYSGAAA